MLNKGCTDARSNQNELRKYASELKANAKEQSKQAKDNTQRKPLTKM